MEQTELPPLLWAPLPSFTRLRYLVAICVIKAFLGVGWSLRRLLVMLGFAPKFSGSPSFSKAYICRPKLTHRFFYPKSYQSGESLPVYISIHGGGFAFGTPEHDDEFCVFFSNNFNLLVISIDYSLAPWSTFPVPTEDVAAVMLAILADSTLPIDHSRVAIGGFSAGGNLALSASQLPALQGKIKAAITWFAPVDWSVDYDYKLASRSYKRPQDIDGLAAVAPIFNNVYLPTGTNQRDPLLSIFYAKREVLPEWIYGISAEYDMLGDELKRMMMQLAGSHQPPLESEQHSFERDGGKIKWTMAKDAEHTFTHWWLKRGKAANLAKPAAEQSFIDAGRWLTERVFAQ
ncbi:Alpha/Beta hydrolase protein [Ilyonectria destructans]|nr:Alpha/Beta hydrolase protein [Ilyonectria destructans]